MSLRKKLVIVVLVTSAFVGALLSLYGARTEAMSSRARIHRHLDQQTALLEILAREVQDESRLASAAGEFAERSGLRVLYLDASARVRIDSGQVRGRRSGERPFDPPPFTLSAEIAEARVLGRGLASIEDPIRGTVLSFARRIDDREGLGFVVGQLRARQAEAAGDTATWPLALALTGAFGFLVLAVYALTSRLLRPLARLTQASERVAAGALDEPLPEADQAEIRRLRTAVEKMRASLVAQLKDLERERRLLRTTTEGLQEGLLLVSSTGRILLANQAIQRLLRLPSGRTARQLTEVVRHPEVLGVIEQCLEEGEEQQAAVSGVVANNRSYQIEVRPVELLNGRGALAIFFDVTRIEALERVRRQFVADVSHELKTPVTAIRGAIETLLDADLKLSPIEARFLEIARRQAERMNHLITDLLDLSRIETGAIELNLEDVRLRPLAERVAEAALSRRPDCGVETLVDVAHDLTVYADERRLEQVLQNLVDNAVKFSPATGRVTLNAFATSDATVIRVRDSGPGIPPDAVEKVFNRFFRLDEARTRDAGGTGIGLSIVKHLMKLHHGTVRVESPPGQGASFILEFPHAPS